MKKQLIILLILASIFSACKKGNEQKAETIDKVQTDSNTEMNVSKNKDEKKVVPDLAKEISIEDFVALLPKMEISDLFNSDSVFVISNQMALPVVTKDNVSNYFDSVKDLQKEVKNKVYFNEYPEYDGENFSPNGVFVNQPPDEVITVFLENSKINKDEAEKVEDSIVYEITSVSDGIETKFYISKKNNHFYITVIDISTPDA